MGQYGQASAGEGRNLGETCKGVMCDASDYSAWREAGLRWVTFYNALYKAAQEQVPVWTPAAEAGKMEVSLAAGNLLKGEPWIYTTASDVLLVAEAQQTLRDYCGVLAEMLASAGKPVDAATAPTEPPPPPPSSADTTMSVVGAVTTLAAVLVGGYLLVKVLK